MNLEEAIKEANRKSKEDLIKMISTKACYGIDCVCCPIRRLNQTAGLACYNRDELCKIAVSLYLEHYGSEEDLVEILL